MKPSLSGFTVLALGLGLGLALSLAAPAAVAQVETGAAATGTFGIERGTGRVICTGDRDGLGEGVAPLDPSYAASALWDRMMLGADAAPCRADISAPPPAPAPVFQQVDRGYWERTSSFAGQDAAGRRAVMRIYILDASYSWALGSSRRVESPDDAPATLGDVFDRPAFAEQFCAAEGAVAIGAASFEGETEANRRLAANRARTLLARMEALSAQCPGANADAGPALLAANLGEFTSTSPCMADGTCTGRATSPQRRVVLVGVDDAQPGTDILQAVRSGLRGEVGRSVLSVDDYEVWQPVAAPG